LQTALQPAFSPDILELFIFYSLPVDLKILRKYMNFTHISKLAILWIAATPAMLKMPLV
jgi:hypothetical protein